MIDSDPTIVEKLGDAGDVAFRDDICLHLSKEDCIAAADLIKGLKLALDEITRLTDANCDEAPQIARRALEKLTP